MREDDIMSYFSALSTDDKIYLLSSLGHQITVCARSAYPGQGQEQEVTKKLRTFNEIEHTVTGQLTHMLARDNKWYTDNDFIDILFDKARNGGCEEDLLWAFDFALKPLLPSIRSG